MKQIFIFCGIAAFAFSCSKGDSDGSTDPTTPPGTDITLPLTVQVTSGSYSASDGLENVPVTLNEGDAIGLYILRNGNPDATAVKLTLGSDGTWSASEELEHTEGNRYFACYPWQEQPSGAIHADAATVAAAPVVGIVYQIDPNRISDAEKEALGGKVHGQVISSQMLIPRTQNSSKWCTYGGQGNRDESSIGLKPIPDLNSDHATNVKLADAAIDGYYYTTQILSPDPAP